MTNPIRLFIVDDHAVVRGGLRALVATRPELVVIGEAQNGAEAVTQVTELQPDVTLMDLVMPKMDGIEAIREIRKILPEARILVITSFAEDEKVFPAIKAGAAGYILKDSSPEELLQAIQDVYNGESALDPAIARKLIREINRPSPASTEVDPLTDREQEVLKLLAQGLSNQEIGVRLNISGLTVRTHISNILSKLHLSNRTQAALYAMREGIV